MNDAELIQAADEARRHAYVPYSRFPVGAALLTEDGQLYTGCNVENAAYPVSLCAERVALFKAVSEGRRRFRTLAVVTDTGGSPCGSCRQALTEFAPDLEVIVADGRGEARTYRLDELLPHSFTAKELQPRPE